MELPAGDKTALELIVPMHEATKKAWKNRGQ